MRLKWLLLPTYLLLSTFVQGCVTAAADESLSPRADASTVRDVATADAPSDDAPSAPPIVVTPAPAALSSVLGTWYLNVGGARVVATFAWDTIEGSLHGTILDESVEPGTTPDALTEVAWDDAGALRFRRTSANRDDIDWYRVSVVEGVLTGRVAPHEPTGAEPLIARYLTHVTGWNATYLDRDLVPRTWDLLFDNGERATLRIDRSRSGLTAYAGTLKVYATQSRGIVDEQFEHDVGVLYWDGVHLGFYVMDGELQRYYSGTVAGRTIAGRYSMPDTGDEHMWAGDRHDVLGYGLASRSVAEREAWQSRARRQIAHMVMADAPEPITTEVTVLADDLAPMVGAAINPARDDAEETHPQGYRLSEVRITYKLPNPYGTEPLTRWVHAYVARPTTPAPAGGYPVAVAVNGHFGSAYQAMSPDNAYWYGDAFARRGYLVVAVDVSHRPLADRRGLYVDLTDGDDPAHGNGTHPSVAAPGMGTDWEEDGERAWDLMRGVDYALSQPGVNARRVVTVGLSMGGEVTSIAGALDERQAVVIPTGFSPDVAVYRYRHHACWDWAYADVNEYIDVSDYHALVAPRGLVVETGRLDTTYSVSVDPFASDKQVLRRSRAAFRDVPERVIHYLHYDGHAFHVGGVAAAVLPEWGVRVPRAIAPTTMWSDEWQGDEETRVVAPTLFDAVERLLR